MGHCRYFGRELVSGARGIEPSMMADADAAVRLRHIARSRV